MQWLVILLYISINKLRPFQEKKTRFSTNVGIMGANPVRSYSAGPDTYLN